MTDELDKSVEVIERWDAGGTEYSVDGGVNWWTKEQFQAIQALIADQMIEYQAQLLKDYKEDLEQEKLKAYDRGYADKAMKVDEQILKEEVQDAKQD